MIAASVRRRAAALLISLWLGGCATVAVEERSHTEAAPVELAGVPFYRQEAHRCGPAALATLLSWSGAAVTPQQLDPALFVPERRGTLPLEIAAEARHRGRAAYRLRGGFEALLTELRAGHPVMVLQNRGLEWWPVWHYAVVVGFDPRRQKVVLRSGLAPTRKVGLARFLHTWDRGGRWALLVLPPAALPATADGQAVMAAALGLEGARQWWAAAQLYRSARGRWPDVPAFGFGLGNALRALGREDAAVAAYRATLSAHPDFAPAHNNLALLLAERGRWQEALASASRAVALGGAHIGAYRATLAAIRCRAAGTKACPD